MNIGREWMRGLRSRSDTSSKGSERRGRLGSAYWVSFCLVGALLMVASCRPVRQATVCARGLYFSQTHHTVREPFCTYFRARGGVMSFGYPVSEASFEHGLLVQYFEQVRMEYHPENGPRYRVQLGLLGDTLGRREPPIPASRAPLAFDRACRMYPPTGHTLCEPFKGYYDTHGGLDRFGYPISEPYPQRGVLAQDFQRGRMVLQEGDVRVADWGRLSVRQGTCEWSGNSLGIIR
jgi:hypothetical protein